MLDGNIKQRVCTKFCMKLSKSATETFKMLRGASGEHSLSWTVVFEWHSGFEACKMSVEVEFSGKPSSSSSKKKKKKKKNC
jgi:hypothetical protein